MFTTFADDGTRCTIMGSGDPNSLSVGMPTTCTEGVYLNTLPDTRNPAASTVWVWDGTSAWFARP